MPSASLAATDRADPRFAAAPKLRFILNPRSGRQGRASLIPHLQDLIAARSLDARLSVTEGPGHATILARDAVRSGCSRVVAVGGDGTVNEVAQALRNEPAALAIVPVGSGNGLARHLRLPVRASAALELAISAGGRVAAIDTGTVNGRPFFNAAGLGLDAEVSRRFNALTRRGLPAYLRTGLAAFAKQRPEKCRVTSGGRTDTWDALLITVANSEQYGNGAVIAPGAKVDDGLLDLIAVGPVGPVAAAFLAVRLFLGTFDRSTRVRRLQGTRFEIERAAPGAVHTDGETHGAPAALEFAVHPRSLRVLLP